MIRAFILASVLVVPALASPPPAGSPDAAELAPFTRWIQRQARPGAASCCSTADGREVEYRVRDGHYEVRFLYPQDVGGDNPPQRGRWYVVPPSAILRTDNPTGVGVAWWYPGGADRQDGSPIRCFAPASGA